jgi:hypothetical protein
MSGCTPVVDEPMSLVSWRREGEIAGHSVAETLGYLPDCADWADGQEMRRGSSPTASGLRRLVPWRWRRKT